MAGVIVSAANEIHRIGIFILHHAGAPYSRSWDSLGFGASFQT
jgi:hypothetical protein